jgi:hydroxylamine reductase
MGEMFCYQCQEAAGNKGCTVRGVCGKKPQEANLMDLAMYICKGISFYGQKLRELGEDTPEKVDSYIMDVLFATVTNTNFNPYIFEDYILQGLTFREQVKNQFYNAYKEKKGKEFSGDLPEAAYWHSDKKEDWYDKATKVGVLSTENVDVRSLRELAVYGIKGMAAYAHHAYVLGKKDKEIFNFMQRALAANIDDSLSADDLTQLVIDCGHMGVQTMALLDEANTSTYGHPEPTKVNLGVRNNPGILISGHDLKDMEELLEQTKGTGVDVYTHSEMLPANSYPAFKKYDHFVGNYGSSWWNQNVEFEKFNGPILMTTNCLVPPKDSYKERVYTTSVVGFEGLTHIPNRKEGKQKDFSQIIEHAKKCKAPEKLEEGTIDGGWARNTVLSNADKIIDLVQKGKIKRFFVMGGCDGRFPSRAYYTEFAQALPEDTVIMTAGCAKYRYNKLPLGDIEGVPRILDAGQCNDSYSLAYIALKLKEVLKLDDINELPISYNIAWYEQKAVLVFLALLALGVRKIYLGPSLPAFVSQNVLKVLQDKFDVRANSTVEADMKAMLG